jgi:hypothetical protein
MTGSRPTTAGAVTARDIAATDRIADTWTRFWFAPADPRPLVAVRILVALLGLALWWSYRADLQAWFGPQGMLPVDTVAAIRPPAGLSLYDLATTPTAVGMLFAATGVALVLLGLGVVLRVVAPVAAVLWASLLNRGPVLAGPADDCLAVLLWCLVVAAFFPAVARGLLQVHAAVIAAAAAVAQLKGDVWWNGTAAWWLAVREDSRLVNLSGLFAASEYVMNLVTHAIPAFALVFAAGLWFTASQPLVARAGLVAWPLIGIIGGQPWWGVALAIFCVPSAWPRPNA